MIDELRLIPGDAMIGQLPYQKWGIRIFTIEDYKKWHLRVSWNLAIKEENDELILCFDNFIYMCQV